MNILHERALEKQVNNTSRKLHIPSLVWLQNWRVESIWCIVNLDLTFASLLVWFSCSLASNVQFLTFSRSENLSIWDSPDTSLWFTQKCHFPNHGISLCITAWLLGSPVSTPLIFWGESRVPAPSLTALEGILLAPCPAPSFTRQFAALHLGKIPLTSWETSLSSLVPAVNILSMNLDKTCIKRCDGWIQIFSVAGAPLHPNFSH